MPVVQRSEFSLALNQVATERGVEVVVVMDTVKNAILAAYRKDHPGIEIEEYSATLNANTGEARIFHKEEDVTPPGFGRIAAQTAKQVILQKIREKEKEAIVTDYRARIGTIVNGMVLKFAGPNVIVDIGKAEGLMPPNEQMQGEKYHLNQRLAVHILDIREGLKGEEIIVSRASNGLLEGLFKREVPEVSQGSVIIKAIAREPGSRVKIAVASNQTGIDPVGSCVGQKGVRVQAIIAELSGLEKIDIIQWQENPKLYIAQALSPAKNVTVEISEKEKLANVMVPEEDLSLAIGKGGQNVRLASMLTGYRIEIKGAASELEKPATTETHKEQEAQKLSASEPLSDSVVAREVSPKEKKVKGKKKETKDEKTVSSEIEKVEQKEATAPSEQASAQQNATQTQQDQPEEKKEDKSEQVENSEKQTESNE